MNINKFQNFADIVVVDDVETEGNEIVDALKSIKIPSVFYFIETDDDLPKEPLSNLRVIFFDLHYSESNPLYSDAVRASIALDKLNKFIGKDSFYVLVVWSSHSQQPIYDEFVRQLQRQEAFAKPVKVFSMDKIHCRNPQLVIDCINKGFQTIPLFEIFLTWERLVSNAVTRSLNEAIGNKDNVELSKLLNTLASALGGDHPDKTTPKQALYALNSILEDNVGRELESGKFGTIHKKIVAGELTDLEKAAFNVAMVFDSYSGLEGAGSIYKRRKLSAGRKREVIQSFLNTQLSSIGTQLDKIEAFYADVTPLCDSATGKGNKYYIEGVIHPKYYINTGGASKEIKVQTYCHTLAKTFLINSEESCFTVNLRSYVSEASTIPKLKTPYKKLRDNLVIDIQHKVAEYLSRPGHIWL